MSVENIFKYFTAFLSHYTSRKKKQIFNEHLYPFPEHNLISREMQFEMMCQKLSTTDPSFQIRLLLQIGKSTLEHDDFYKILDNKIDWISLSCTNDFSNGLCYYYYYIYCLLYSKKYNCTDFQTDIQKSIRDIKPTFHEYPHHSVCFPSICIPIQVQIREDEECLIIEPIFRENLDTNALELRILYLRSCGVQKDNLQDQCLYKLNIYDKVDVISSTQPYSKEPFYKDFYTYFPEYLHDLHQEFPTYNIVYDTNISDYYERITDTTNLASVSYYTLGLYYDYNHNFRRNTKLNLPEILPDYQFTWSHNAIIQQGEDYNTIYYFSYIDMHDPTKCLILFKRQDTYYTDQYLHSTVIISEHLDESNVNEYLLPVYYEDCLISYLFLFENTYAYIPTLQNKRILIFTNVNLLFQFEKMIEEIDNYSLKCHYRLCTHNQTLFFNNKTTGVNTILRNIHNTWNGYNDWNSTHTISTEILFPNILPKDINDFIVEKNSFGIETITYILECFFNRTFNNESMFTFEDQYHVYMENEFETHKLQGDLNVLQIDSCPIQDKYNIYYPFLSLFLVGNDFNHVHNIFIVLYNNMVEEIFNYLLLSIGWTGLIQIKMLKTIHDLCIQKPKRSVVYVCSNDWIQYNATSLSQIENVIIVYEEPFTNITPYICNNKTSQNRRIRIPFDFEIPDTTEEQYDIDFGFHPNKPYVVPYIQKHVYHEYAEFYSFKECICKTYFTILHHGLPSWNKKLFMNRLSYLDIHCVPLEWQRYIIPNRSEYFIFSHSENEMPGLNARRSILLYIYICVVPFLITCSKKYLFSSNYFCIQFNNCPTLSTENNRTVIPLRRSSGDINLIQIILEQQKMYKHHALIDAVSYFKGPIHAVIRDIGFQIQEHNYTHILYKNNTHVIHIYNIHLGITEAYYGRKPSSNEQWLYFIDVKHINGFNVHNIVDLDIFVYLNESISKEDFHHIQYIFTSLHTKNWYYFIMRGDIQNIITKQNTEELKILYNYTFPNYNNTIDWKRFDKLHAENYLFVQIEMNNHIVYVSNNHYVYIEKKKEKREGEEEGAGNTLECFPLCHIEDIDSLWLSPDKYRAILRYNQEERNQITDILKYFYVLLTNNIFVYGQIREKAVSLFLPTIYKSELESLWTLHHHYICTVHEWITSEDRV
jgi:hypothetical protein